MIGRHKTQVKVIGNSEEDVVERWELPAVRCGEQVTVDSIEKIQEQAHREGYARGYREGLAGGQTQIKRLEQLMAVLSEPFADLDQQVEQELLLLAQTIARQLVRRELKTDPAQVVAVVREAMASLPVASRSVCVHLHPEDAALVREVLSLEQAEGSWKIAEDPVMARGGCRVVTDSSRIDATLEARLTALVTSVMGGERGHDRPPNS